MGCLFPKFGTSERLDPQETAQPKVYSWDRREKINVKDYMFENLKNETVGRMPGTINGQQFVIQKCEDCNIYLFDHMATVTMDDCVNCRVFMGPIQSSVFIRNSKQCKVIVSCQQFRTRDCSKIDVFLACTTQPIIEASTGMKFACYQYNFPGLEDMFKQAELSVYNNNWSNVHDYTPVPGESNITILPEDISVQDYIPLPTSEPLNTIEISTERDRSVLPVTLGSRRKPSDESCLTVFFSDGGSHERAKKFIDRIQEIYSACRLVQSKEIPMQPDDAMRVFASDSYAKAVLQGPVIGLEFNGEDCTKICQEIVIDLAKGTTGLAFVSQNSTVAASQIENFYNYADMQMTV